MLARFLALIILFAPSVSWGAITEVASMRASGEYTNVDFTAALAFPNNVTAGDLLIAAGTNWKGSSQTIAVSGCSTTWTTIHGADRSGAGGIYRTWVAYGIAGVSGACTPTVDPGSTSNYGSYSLNAFRGSPSTPLDVDGGDSTGTGTTASDSITTGTANALIIGVMLHTDTAANRTLTAGGSYTQFGEIESVANAPHHAEFRIATTATAYTVDATIGTSVTWSMQTVSFKEATAAATVCTMALLGAGC